MCKLRCSHTEKEIGMTTNIEKVESILASKYDTGRSKHGRFKFISRNSTTKREIVTVEVQGIHIVFYITKKDLKIVFLWQRDGLVSVEEVAPENAITELEYIIKYMAQEEL